MVPLSTLATIKSTSGPDYTVRFNLFRAVEVTGGPAPGYTSAQAMQALKEVAAETLPADMTTSCIITYYSKFFRTIIYQCMN